MESQALKLEIAITQLTYRRKVILAGLEKEDQRGSSFPILVKQVLL